MQTIFKKKKDLPKVDQYNIPMSSEMKQELKRLKEEKAIDVNEMGRRFFEKMIKKAKAG